MKGVTTLVAFALMISSQFTFAAEEVLLLKGKGLDGKACEVKIIRDGDSLKSVELTGASKIFEILSENEDGYGPETRISPNGGEEVLQLLQDNPALYDEMKITSGIFTNSKTYTLDTSDLPRTDEDLKGIKAKIGLNLKFKGRELSKVSANFKGKVLLVTIASSTFECSK